ncbi:glycoside hydrolase family 2 protein [Algibacter mikhailovii]|uniref:Beta-galactosidase n=1 Tax=Algibacter mikhailovii TaxID=425498 RepID=A0A918R272_9FLAO|nr:glycoside hydrolase family 2 TIM barrel-domain containing protein [Algibacter mikhailovii]GGZ81743.1 beta-galactosidase [Algibacter mikhailovii]
MYKLAIQFICLILVNVTLNAQALLKSPEYSKAGFFEVPNSGRQVYDFNVGWRFYKGVIERAELSDFDDSTWNVVNTPHGLELNASEASGSTNYQGEAWYRKHFTIPKNLLGKKLTIHFEAIMGKSKVWLNGELLTTHYGGYLPFSIDITNKVLKDKENVLAVWADNSDDPNYPPGKSQTVLDFSYFGGIYRDVWLLATNNVYVTNPNTANKVAGGGLFVRYENLTKKSVEVITKTDISNDSKKSFDISITYNLKDDDNNIVATKTISETIKARSNIQVEQILLVKTPKLWSPKSPFLYNLEVLIQNQNQNIIDGVRQKIGIRKIEFRGKEGFYLNNEPYDGKLMGVNRHQDYAYVGNALPNSGQWRDALILKEAGSEIIRAAHYPADPAFMDACDVLGLFFIVATPGWQFWNDDNTQFQELVYQDIRNMVRRDRNHASVILWEPILNETHYPDYFAETVHNIVHEEYPYPGAYTACDSRAKGMEYFDVIYDHPRYADKFKVWMPDPKGKNTSKIKFDYGAENRSIFTREWGDNVDDWNAHNSSSRVARNWGESPQLIQAHHYANTAYRFTNWESISSTPAQHVGGALWHAFDHQRGYHPDPFYGGIADVFRQPKYSYYLFNAQRKAKDSEPMVYIAHEMSPFSSKDVTVYSNCDEVRLIVLQKDTITMKHDRETFNMPNPIMVFEDVYDFMEVKSLYRKKRHAETTIVAEGIIDGKVVVSATKMPTNRITRIKLELADYGIPLTANGSDFVPVIASIVDDNGNVKRLTENHIKFEVEGEGTIIGDSDIMANPRTVEWGTAPVLIRATEQSGTIVVKASMVHEGVHTPMAAKITINSIPTNTPLIFDEKTNTSYKKAVSKPIDSNNQDSTLKQKVLELEKELNQYKLKEVQKQQEEFENESKKN